jgi:3-deoxy-D-manno-octulosonate 8-phosphate phosphatase (KDO 8-P phosphatase)
MNDPEKLNIIKPIPLSFMKNNKAILKEIKAFVFDMDGVCGTQQVICMPDGEPLRTLNIRDGYAMQLLVKKGSPVAIISGGGSEGAKERFRRIGVTDVFMRADNKVPVFERFLSDNKLEAKQVAYMGDDIPDYRVMKMAGLAACPADAAPEIKEISGFISSRKGGEGCARELIEQCLRAQGKWMNEDAFHW